MNVFYFIYLELIVRQLSRSILRSFELEAIILGVCEGVFLTLTARDEQRRHDKISASSYLPILLTLSAALDAFFFARLEATFAHALGGVLGVLLAEYGPSVWDDGWEYNDDHRAFKSRSSSKRRYDVRVRTRASTNVSRDADASRGRSTTQRAVGAERNSRTFTDSLSTISYREEPTPAVPLHPPPDAYGRRRSDTLPQLTVDTNAARARQSIITDRVMSTRTARFSIASPQFHAPVNRSSEISAGKSTRPRSHTSSGIGSPVVVSPSTQSAWSQSMTATTPVPSLPQQYRAPVASSHSVSSAARTPTAQPRGRQPYVEEEGEGTPRASPRSISVSRSRSRTRARNEGKRADADDVWVKVETPVLRPVASASGNSASNSIPNSGNKSPKKRLSANRLSGIFNQDIGDISFLPDKDKKRASPGGMKTPTSTTMPKGTSRGTPSPAGNMFFGPPSPNGNRQISPTRDRPISLAGSPKCAASQAPNHPDSPGINVRSHSQPPSVTGRPSSRSSWVLPTFGEQTSFNMVETTVHPDDLESPSQAPLPVPTQSTPTGPNIPSIAEDILSTSEVTGEESVVTITPSRAAALARASELRNMADQAMSRRGDYEKERKNALKMKQFGSAFEYKFKRDEAEAEAERLNRRAARRFQKANNANSHISERRTLDVHGLKKKEAITCVETRLRELQLAGQRRLKVIVGRGKHSKRGIAVLKPAVLSEMQKQGFQASVDKGNPGVVHISMLNG